MVNRIGNFITGTSVPDEEEVLSAGTKQLGDGRDYYLYEVWPLPCTHLAPAPECALLPPSPPRRATVPIFAFLLHTLAPCSLAGVPQGLAGR